MNKRQAAFLLFKLCFAATVLSVLFRKVDLGHVWESISDATPTPILGGFVLCWTGVLIAGWRWQRLLTIFKISIPLRSLICITQIGQFFMMFLPGPTGDDLTRMLYISRLAKGRVSEACTSVLIDRLIGLASILALAVLCVPGQWHLLATSKKTYWLAVGIMTAGAAVCVAGALFFLAGHRIQRWFALRLRALPAHHLRNEMMRISGLLCAHKRQVAHVIAAALGTQLLLCIVFYLAGSAVGIHIPLLTWLGFVPIVLAANAVPITVAGIGVREYLLVLFLGVLAQVEGERALAASLVAFAIILTVCLLGGIVYIFYRPKSAADPEG